MITIFNSFKFKMIVSGFKLNTGKDTSSDLMLYWPW
jgi:hypothetical protein